MGKIAFLFPGQGAQAVGMGQDFYENYPVAKATYDLASEVTGINVADLCFIQNENINITEYTQLALLTTEIAIMKVILDKGVNPDYCAGLSLGEYGALKAANVMSDEDIFKLIRLRGIYMQEAYPVGGAMSAVLGLNAEDIMKVLETIDGIVSIANDNCPGQIVITGAKDAVLKANEELMKAGAKKCVELNVSGPFHSELLQGAGEKLKDALKDIEISSPSIPYISNVTADIVDSKDEIKTLLEKQVSSPVRFRESILKLKDMGVDTYIEIGPGKTLAGFIRRIDKELKVINIEKVDDLIKLEEGIV